MRMLRSHFYAILVLICLALVCVIGCTKADNRADPSLEWVTSAVDAQGLRHCTFPSKVAKTQVSYHIYIPPQYETGDDTRFPVLYWLHGTGGGLPGLPYLAKYFGDAITTKKIPPMLVVFPNGMFCSLWSNSKDGKVPMEDVVIRELIPHTDLTYRTIRNRKARIIEGFSMGGYGAARYGFKHFGLFGSVSILSGGPLQEVFTDAPRVGPKAREQVFQDVFGGDMEYFKAISPWRLAETYAAAAKMPSNIRLVIGKRDEMLANVQKFHDRLSSLAIKHNYIELPGVGHNTVAVLKALGEGNYEFYRRAFDELPLTK